jgi:hypothetical protein
MSESETCQEIYLDMDTLVGVAGFDSDRLRAFLTLKDALTRCILHLALRAASRSKSAVLPICRRAKFPHTKTGSILMAGIPL